jgi:hypothetical protein
MLYIDALLAQRDSKFMIYQDESQVRRYPGNLISPTEHLVILHLLPAWLAERLIINLENI